MYFNFETERRIEVSKKTIPLKIDERKKLEQRISLLEKTLHSKNNGNNNGNCDSSFNIIGEAMTNVINKYK